MDAEHDTHHRWSAMSPSRPFPSGKQEPGGDIGLHRGKSSRLWLWFVAAFALQVAAWGAWFFIASQHPVREVPLARMAPNP